MLPIKHCHNFTLSFQLPPQHSHWRSLPTNYIGHLLGHEGGGSILSLIKSNGWASGIVAGVGEDGATNASCHCLMQISVMMSEAGVGHIEEILEMIFSYVSMLKDTYKAGGNKFPEYIFEELKSTHAMAYNFASEEQPEEFVENIVTCLSPCRSYPPEYLLTGGELLHEEDGEAVMAILDRMTVENARVDVMSSLWGVVADFEGEGTSEREGTSSSSSSDAPPPPPPLKDSASNPPLPDHLASLPIQTEPIFGTKFWSKPLSAEVVSRLKSPATFPLLALPQANAFVPTNFSLRPFPSNDAAHPLLNATVKAAAASSGKKNKFGTFYCATVTKYNEKKNALTLVYEDEEVKEVKVGPPFVLLFELFESNLKLVAVV